MSIHSEFNWCEPVLIDGEAFGPDCLNRTRYADFLTAFLRGQSQSKPYVLNLNSEWGTGKTYFLKRWKHDLSKRHPVIYIDAWKNDHSDDPLMSVVSSVISQLRAKTDKKEDSALSRGYEFGARLVKEIAPIIAGGLAKKYIGLALDEIYPDKIDGAKPSNSNDNIDKAAQKITNLLMSEHEKKASSISSLKNTMKEWIDTVIGQNNSIDDKVEHPTFIIIDELDRCRPSYAVEILEIVKHIFDVPGVFFIVATDTEQLQHAIKVVYGLEFDAKTYLSRFFDSRFTLPTSTIGRTIFSRCDTSVFESEYLDDNDIKIWPIGNASIDNVAAVIDAFNIPARNAIQILERITAVVRFLRKDDSRIDLIYLATLFCLQFKDEKAYRMIVEGKEKQDYSIFAAKFDATKSKNKISIRVYFDNFHGQYVNDSIELAAYYEKVFLDYSGAFNNRNLTGLVFNNLKDDDETLTKRVMTKVDELHGKSRNKEYEMELASISYLNYRMYTVNRSIYKNLVELAISFD
ncbi:KAP family P-loop NTPase fold protein [Aeromonas caviae]|uniref:KAP family P-loop NTPase fold protein n=1 Tax=Aeromonas caviae TaxID=648 RepID=UPI0029DAA1A7|nr:P-loop NTPase fold protein [Aeromonas caviae]MDX7786735.1 P-loop NTPase fold protein [Aeromonas caviae]